MSKLTGVILLVIMVLVGAWAALSYFARNIPFGPIVSYETQCHVEVDDSINSFQYDDSQGLSQISDSVAELGNSAIVGVNHPCVMATLKNVKVDGDKSKFVVTATIGNESHSFQGGY